MRELFDQLRADADRQTLPEPALLRMRSDRRAARRMATGFLAIVLAFTGGFYAMQPDHRADFELATETPIPAWVASVTPSHDGPRESAEPTGRPTCRDSYAKKIPDDAFVQGGAEICFDPVEPLFFVESIPTPCRPDKRPTDALIQDRRGFENIVAADKTGGPTAIHQVITRYSAQGATQFVSELSRDVNRCGPYTTPDLRLSYSVVTSDLGMVQLKARYEALKKSNTGPPVATYVVLVKRVGSYVAVVYDKGWEGYPSDQQTLIKFFDSLVSGVPPI